MGQVFSCQLLKEKLMNKRSNSELQQIKTTEN